MSKNPCEEARHWLNAIADQQVTTEIPAAVTLHAASCPDCGKEIRLIQSLKLSVRESARREVAPPGLETRIRARLEQSRPAPWWAAPLPRLALASALLVTVTVGVWATVYRPMRQQIAQILGIGLGDHIHCAVDRKSTAGSFNRPLPAHHAEIVTATQKALPPELVLIESHSCGFRGRRFTHIVFGNADKRISVLVTPKESGEKLPTSAILANMRSAGIPVYADSVAAGINAAAIETGDSWAYVVSDLDAQANLNLMAAIAPAVVAADRPAAQP